MTLPGGLAVLPGPASGEGCSLEGGCAACPYMRMNTLAALQGVCEKVGVVDVYSSCVDCVVCGLRPPNA